MIRGLSARIKEQRKKYGLSQDALAKKLHVAASTVSAYETGERTPSTEVILQLSYMFHCTTDYLFGKEKDIADSISTEGLTEEQKTAIFNLVESMRK